MLPYPDIVSTEQDILDKDIRYLIMISYQLDNDIRYLVMIPYQLDN